MNYTNGSTSGSLPMFSFSDDDVAMTTTSDQYLLLTRFIVQKLCVPLVVLIGVIGNSLSVVVLTQKCMKSSTNSYLTALAAFDLLYLVFSLSLSFQHHHLFKYSSAYVHYFPYARVFTDMFANMSVIITVTFTVERYIGVCHPMKGRILCTVQRAKAVTAVVSIATILCTTPEFWEMEVVWERMNNNQTVPRAVYTSFANQASYTVGYYSFLVVVFTLLPLLLLCVFNGILIATVFKAAKLRKEMIMLTPVSISSKRSRSIHSQPREQHKITKMLITVVIVFIVCQLPGALLLLYRTYISLGSVHTSRLEENSIKIAGNITNLLIQINAAINFILYSAISTKFRCVFYRITCSRERECACISQRRHRHSFSKSEEIQMSYFYVQLWTVHQKCKTCPALWLRDVACEQEYHIHTVDHHQQMSPSHASSDGQL